MNRTFRTLWALLSSRALPPLVLGFFLLLYIGIAFFTDETLITLMAIVRRMPTLVGLFALLPLNGVCRMVLEGSRYLKRRRALSGSISSPVGELFHETVELSAPPSFAPLEERLRGEGYATGRNGDRLAGWRGVTLLPARLLYLAGMFSLLAGILVSLTSRSVNRQEVVEGAPFPAPGGNGGLVRSITFRNGSGWILAKELEVEVADPDSAGGVARFGVYPPARFRGAFVYPRYLGVALVCRISAPDTPGGCEKSVALPLYPPGREASTVVTGTPYKLTLTLLSPEDGSDPYTTGKMLFGIKLLKGKELLLTGTLPGGGEFRKDGYTVTIPDCRRMVMTDFVTDYGVLLIWWAAFLFTASFLLRFAVSIFFPRREMLFLVQGENIRAFSRAEGRKMAHAGVFHETLDLLESSLHENS
jgi:hypothetical protein